MISIILFLLIFKTFHTFKSPVYLLMAPSHGSSQKSSVWVLLPDLTENNRRSRAKEGHISYIILYDITQVHIYYILIYGVRHFLKIGRNSGCCTDRCRYYLWFIFYYARHRVAVAYDQKYLHDDLLWKEKVHQRSDRDIACDGVKRYFYNMIMTALG